MKKKLMRRAVMMIYANNLQLITLEHPTGDIYVIHKNALTQLENTQYFVERS